MTANLISQETEIHSRVISPDNPTFSADAARSILSLGFAEADNDRINDLAAKAREGTLNDQEEADLHAYIVVGAMVDLMHTKARLSLKKSGAWVRL